nr:RICIN domain-containing protein [Streptomyces canus]
MNAGKYGSDHYREWDCRAPGGRGRHCHESWTVSGSAIVSARSGLCLGVSGNSTAQDHAIIQWSCKNTTNQQWS